MRVLSAVLLLQSTNGDKNEIKKQLIKLGAGGSYRGCSGLITAYEIAQKNFIKMVV